MNKAFLREPEQTDSPCPRCHSRGESVGPQTLNARLTAAVRQGLAESAYFCPYDRCDVVYYDDFGAVVTRDSVSDAIPIKDADAPLCACFGVTRDEIEADVAEGGVARTRAAVLRAQSEEARCATLAPNGRSCVAVVQGYFLKCKQRAGGS